MEPQLLINVLGITLYTDLSFQTHAIDVANRTNKVGYLISKLKKFMNVEETLRPTKL